jgi:hypothetical protein
MGKQRRIWPITIAVWENNNLRSPNGPCLVNMTYRNNPITTVGTESSELKTARMILIPGKLPFTSEYATSIAGGVVRIIALRETENESITIDHSSGSPVTSKCNAF